MDHLKAYFYPIRTLWYNPNNKLIIDFNLIKSNQYEC